MVPVLAGKICGQASSGATPQVNTCGEGGDTAAKEDSFINGQRDQALLGINSKGMHVYSNSYLKALLLLVSPYMVN